MGYLYIFGTIFFTVYGQLILKWQVGKAGEMPGTFMGIISFFCSLLLNPWVISGFLSAFLASLCWMATLTKFEMSFAYPFMSCSFVTVLIFGVVLFGESLNVAKVASMVLIIAGIIIGSRG